MVIKLAAILSFLVVYSSAFYIATLNYCSKPQNLVVSNVKNLRQKTIQLRSSNNIDFASNNYKASLNMIKPLQDRTPLYVMHFFFAFASRMWDMGIVLLIAEITNNSLFLVAATGFISSLSIFLFMSSIGSWLDRNNRMLAVKLTLGTKAIAVSIAYLITVLLNHKQLILAPSIRTYALYTLPILCAIAGVAFSTITQSVEKDWIVVLSGGDSAWLSETNSFMSQIDLACSSLAPAVTGFLFSTLSREAAAVSLLLTNGITTAFLYSYMNNLYRSWPLLANRNKDSSDNKNKSESTTTSNQNKAMPKKSSFFLSEFLASGCSGTMIAYSFLYLTVLSFGSLMTVYLRTAGITDKWIGISRGLASLTGFAGAFLFPFFMRRFGLWMTSQMAIGYQSILVSIAALSMFWARSRVLVITMMVTVVCLLSHIYI